MCAKSIQSYPLFATLWTVAHRAPLSDGILQTRLLEKVAISSSLWFQTSFRIFFFPARNYIGNLIGNTLTLQWDLGSKDILTILILPVPEHELSFHLCVSSYCRIIFH